MNVRSLRDGLTLILNHGADPNAEVEAWDPDSEEWEEVSGYDYGDGGPLRFYTNEGGEAEHIGPLTAGPVTDPDWPSTAAGLDCLWRDIYGAQLTAQLSPLAWLPAYRPVSRFRRLRQESRRLGVALVDVLRALAAFLPIPRRRRR